MLQAALDLRSTSLYPNMGCYVSARFKQSLHHRIYQILLQDSHTSSTPSALISTHRLRPCHSTLHAHTRSPNYHKRLGSKHASAHASGQHHLDLSMATQAERHRSGQANRQKDSIRVAIAKYRARLRGRTGPKNPKKRRAPSQSEENTTKRARFSLESDLDDPEGSTLLTSTEKTDAASTKGRGDRQLMPPPSLKKGSRSSKITSTSQVRLSRAARSRRGG